MTKNQQTSVFKIHKQYIDLAISLINSKHGDMQMFYSKHHSVCESLDKLNHFSHSWKTAARPLFVLFFCFVLAAVRLSCNKAG